MLEKCSPECPKKLKQSIEYVIYTNCSFAFTTIITKEEFDKDMAAVSNSFARKWAYVFTKKNTIEEILKPAMLYWTLRITGFASTLEAKIWIAGARNFYLDKEIYGHESASYPNLRPYLKFNNTYLTYVGERNKTNKWLMNQQIKNPEYFI